MQRRLRIESKKKAIALAQAAWDKMAMDPVLIEVKELSDVTDYLLVCSADTVRGVRTIADSVEKRIDELGERVFGMEGYTEGRWVLIDTSDVLVNVFKENLREFYDLEGLWIDTPRIELPFKDGIQRESEQLEKDLG